MLSLLAFLALWPFSLGDALAADSSLSGDSLLLPHQQFSVTEGAEVDTPIGRLVAERDSAITRVALLEARFLGTGTDRNDAQTDPRSAVAVQPTGLLTVNDPTHLLAVNGPLLLTVRATDTTGQAHRAEVVVSIQDQRVDSTGPVGAEWSVDQRAAYPAVSTGLGRNGVIEGQSIVVNGQLYAFGGFNQRFAIIDSAYVYHPQTDRWTSLRALPNGGYNGAGLATDGVDIYIAGGNAKVLNNRPTDSVYRYVVAEDRYENLGAPLPVPVADGALMYLDGKLYFVGGTNIARRIDQSNLYALDLSDVGAGWETLAPLPNPRGHFGAVAVHGRLYVVGGQHQHDGRSVTQDDVHAYDPTTNTWTLVTDLPDVSDVPADIKSLPDSIERLRSAGKSHISSGTYTDGERIYIIGGEYRHGGGAAEGEPGAYYSSASLVYEPATNRWWQLPELLHRSSDTTALRTRSGLGGIIDSTLYYVAVDRVVRTVGLPTVVPEEPEKPEEPSALPTLTSLGAQTHYQGDTLTAWPVLSVADTSTTLIFRAVGLPTGLTLDSLSGTVSGVITAEPGDYPVTVSVTSGGEQVTVDWVWTVVEPLVTHLTETPASTDQPVRLYPNPTAGSLWVVRGGDNPPEELTITFLDAQGKRCWQRSTTSDRTSFDVSHLPAALYWVRVTSHRQTTVHRVVIR